MTVALDSMSTAARGDVKVGGRRKEEGGRRKEKGGRRKEEGGRRKEVAGCRSAFGIQRRAR
jgi:hypothetical protein